MKTFQIANNTIIVCEKQNTRSGFRHIAILIENGNERDRTKVCYQNRAWESYDYETVITKLLKEKTKFTKLEQETILGKIENKDEEEHHSMMKSTAMIAQLGELFGSTIKEKNDWKTRMLNAGLSKEGLEMPDDWETLSEETKKTRLNAVIQCMKENQ